MNYLDQLRNDFKKTNSLVCMGMDPVIDKIPINDTNIKKKIFSFYEAILNEIVKSGKKPSCVKPNYAFYAQYGFYGLEALYHLIALYRKESFTVILDVKRGDIGTTAEAYAVEAFDFFKADAVTLSPYMGYDSIEPFIKFDDTKGYYILCKTSNKSSGEMQDLDCQGTPLFMKTAELITKWYTPGIGAVVGATYPAQLERVLDLFREKKNDVALLIPGVGSQGGDLVKVVDILKSKSDITLQRINASGSINYAYQNYGGNFAVAAVKEIDKLNNEINKIAGI